MKPDLPPTIALLLRYLVLAYLVGSVLFTLHFFFLQYRGPQPAPAIKPRTMTEQGQATFDVENIMYSPQIMKWKSKQANNYKRRKRKVEITGLAGINPID